MSMTSRVIGMVSFNRLMNQRRISEYIKVFKTSMLARPVARARGWEQLQLN